MKTILQYLLALLARLTLKRYKPRVVCVTGNVGKTSTKEAIFAVLSSGHRVRKGEKNYNNEFGVPLTILDMRAHGRNIAQWSLELLGACAKLLYWRYPEIVLLEMGVDKPGDMEYLLSLARPDVAVFTFFGDIPVHVANFPSKEALLREKLKLAWAVPESGTVIVNADVHAWDEIKMKANARVITYGFSDDADIKIESPEYRTADRSGRGFPSGIAIKIQYKGSVVPFRVDGVLHLESGAGMIACACAIGLVFGMNMVEISSALAGFTAPRGRLTPLEGKGNSVILDDTYNASPSSMEIALEAFAALPGKRKIAALGDMLELGEHTEQAHREAGKKAADSCDILITVGPNMSFAAGEATRKGFKEGTNLFQFDNSKEAGAVLARYVREGDVILVKGSQGMRMEKAVEQILLRPEHSQKLLVRQEKSWRT